jgi:protein-disulfide isomerase
MTKFISILLIITLVSCSEKAIEKPKNLIEKATMENILYDLALLQAIKRHDYKILPNNSVDPKKYIFQKYKIDSAQFAQSNKYYSSEIDEYKKMYDRIIEKAEAEKKAIDLKAKKEDKANQKKIRDSISKYSKKEKKRIIAKG